MYLSRDGTRESVVVKRQHLDRRRAHFCGDRAGKMVVVHHPARPSRGASAHALDAAKSSLGKGCTTV
jgi:hypothetical protein